MALNKKDDAPTGRTPREPRLQSPHELDFGRIEALDADYGALEMRALAQLAPVSGESIHDAIEKQLVVLDASSAGIPLGSRGLSPRK